MRKVSLGLGALAAIGALALPVSALADSPQQLTLTPKITGKAGGSGALTVAFTIGNSLGGLPSPLSGNLTVQFPAGIAYSKILANAKYFKTCPYATVNAAQGTTPPSCPAGSQIGTGSAVFAAAIGGAPISENVPGVRVYLTKANPMTVGFWASGTTPILETRVWPGVLSAASGQYGESFVTQPPIITTTPGGPDGSVTSFSATISATTKVKKGKKTTIVPLIPLPKPLKPCPLHWSATANYEDGTSTTSTATTACP